MARQILRRDRAKHSLVEKLVGGRDQTDGWICRAIFAELFCIGDKLVGIDDRRVILVFVIGVQPSQNDFDLLGIAGLKLPACPGRQIVLRPGFETTG